MKGFIRILKSYDWMLIISILLLSGIGLLVMYGIAQHQDKVLQLFYKQSLFIFLGFLIMLFVGAFDYRIFRNWGWASLIAYLAVIVLLVGVLFFGITARGSKSWFVIGLFGIQPVEFAKIVVILVLAKYFGLSHIEIHRPLHIFISGFYVLLPTILVLAQPDLGSVIIILLLWLGLMMIAGIKARHFIILGVIALIIAIAGWMYFLQPYQKNRILTFLNPSLDPLGAGYNRNQALIAIGSGGLFGRGLDGATQSLYGFLPEAANDFMLAAIGESFGLVGVVGVFGLWLLIFWRLSLIARASPNNFSRLFIAGFFIVAMVQFFINAGANFGLLPITGIQSPFISYGGSGFIAFSFAVGLILSINRINKS
ncbi:rod shape-determining protein RodA [Candidatus Parcubacteria bacterium]|nr:MAG: rod shape-determining protein RodA [Candidatus Parcubacteria bacterium]